MLAQKPAISVQQPRSVALETVEPISVKRIVAALQVVLATRRAAYSDENMYWYSLARGM
jgi:hypothetical protein